MKRFRNLSAAQQSAFEQIALGWTRGGDFSPRTLKSLESAGLIQGVDTIDADGWPPITITVREYDVPAGIHREWCAWCAENFDECPQCTGNGCSGCDYSGMVEKIEVAAAKDGE